MCAGAVERILEREIADHCELPDRGFRDRPQLQRERIFLRREAHVAEFDVAAESDRPIESLRNPEMTLGARAGIFVIARIELRRCEVLSDFQPLQDAVGRLERFVDLVRVERLFRFNAGRRIDGIRMELERQMAGRRRMRVVNLNLVEIDCPGARDRCDYPRRGRDRHHQTTHARDETPRSQRHRLAIRRAGARLVSPWPQSVPSLRARRDALCGRPD